MPDNPKPIFMLLNKKLFFSFSLMLATIVVAAQAAGALGDNALNYNRLIMEKTTEGMYKLIGAYKVIGTSYLFGERNKGNLFSKEAQAFNVSLSYNTYNQEVEFYSSSNPDKPLIKETGTVDSFVLNSNESLGITSPLKFVYGSHLWSSEKAYFKEIYAGKRFGLYKRYKSDLGYVSSNYVQSELRQFDLLFDFFYTDSETKTIKKLKPNPGSINKEFKSIKDVSSVIDNEELSTNPEEALRKVFDYLNK